MCRALAQPSAHPHPVPHPHPLPHMYSTDPHAQRTPSWLTQPRAAKYLNYELARDKQMQMQIRTRLQAKIQIQLHLSWRLCPLRLLALSVRHIEYEMTPDRRRQHFAIKRISVTSSRVSSSPYSCSNERENASFSSTAPCPPSPSLVRFST